MSRSSSYLPRRILPPPRLATTALRTDQSLAGTPDVCRRTVHTDVAHMFAKRDVPPRSSAADAARRGLAEAGDRRSPLR
jgi:hypothetical protein